MNETASDDQAAQQNCPPTQTPHTNIITPGTLKLLQNHYPGKAPGPDRIPQRVIKELVYVLAKPLTVIISMSLQDGHVLNDWRLSKITLTYKKES